MSEIVIGMAIATLMLIAESQPVPSAEPLVVPQELPSILSLIYSNIPPIKKGTDSRLGFGFRLGNHADFQVLLELGPQKNTRPIGDNADSENSFNKRQVSKAQRDYLRRKQAQEALKRLNNNIATSTEEAASSWLETWSNAMNANSKSNNSEQSKKKFGPKFNPATVKKEQQPVQLTPLTVVAAPSVEQTMLQLQKLYEMATTTTDTTATMLNDNKTEREVITTTTSTTTEVPPFKRVRPTYLPFKGDSLNLGSPEAFTPRSLEEQALQTISEQQNERKTYSEITKELMDVSLDDEK
ncbi:uncharacterized protein snsl isoform X2 [Eurosta solidaginis]|uniref:uncharacterized protein snsl isoform X2 n=1 Tax=Eurosta solidaginis TaxID=178769 RepID=UPI0035315B5F